jgi:outer membrane protein assembly factor BamB
MRTGLFCALLIAFGSGGCPQAALAGSASDWPQFMRSPERSGDAPDETLVLPLGLVAQVKLDDAVTTSPAVLAGRVYVCDQMGTAYCIDPQAGKVLWKTSPDGPKAMGANTSSPCVANGRVYYGTTAGTFHILGAKDGKVIKTIRLGWPVVASPVCANGRAYIQTVGAVVYCFDPDGKERWRWDHHKSYQHPPYGSIGMKEGDRMRGYSLAQYSNGELCVSGKKVVAAVGWDLICLEDKGGSTSLNWCHRALVGRWPNGGIPLGVSVAAGYVYATAPGSDGSGCTFRVSLSDGSFDAMPNLRKSKDMIGGGWGAFGTIAVQGTAVYYGCSAAGFCAVEPAGAKSEKGRWSTNFWFSPEASVTVVSSAALSKKHCVFTTMEGELIVMDQNAATSEFARKGPAFRFKPPHGKPISSSPAIADGQVYFGCDDGYFYVLGPNGALQPRVEKLTLHEARSQMVPATGRAYTWPYPHGNAANTNTVEDPKLRPPFRLRWASRDCAVFKQPVTTDGNSLYYCSMASNMAAVEQATGRIRWRRCIKRTGYQHGLGRGAVTVSRNSLYLVRGFKWTQGALFCVDARTGRTLWETPVGNPSGSVRLAPVCVDDLVVVCTLHTKAMVPVVQAFSAKEGTEVWQVKLKKAAGGGEGMGGGCLLDGKLFFTRGIRRKNKEKAGLTVALDPKTGRVVWESTEYYGVSGFPTGKDGRIYVGGSTGGGFGGPLWCLSAKDGSVIWRGGGSFSQSPAIAADCYITRYWGGHGWLYSLEDGKPLGRKVGGPTHACGPVRVVLPRLALGLTAGALVAHDLETGKMLWQSRGFAPRTCSSPAIANGRIFVNPQVIGVLFCFEPTAGVRAQ